MNQIDCSYLRCFLIAILSGAFVVSSEMPLLASPQQSSQAQSSQSSFGQAPTSQAPAAESSSSQTQTTSDPLPDAPQPQSSSAQGQPSQAQTAQPQQDSTQTPSGAAGAKAANVKGAPVAQPVGAAVAPARQRGHRSLLIKIGLLAGAGIAVGTVIALSEKSPTRPPGAVAASTHP
jgi:cytoskeletal protein RodZ